MDSCLETARVGVKQKGEAAVTPTDGVVVQAMLGGVQ